MKKILEKIYVVCIISAISITFVQEFVSIGPLMPVKTVFLIGVVGIGLFYARGIILFMSIILLSIGHILIFKYKIGYEVWIEGITKNLPLATIFVVVPILSIPLKLGGYLEPIEYYFKKHIRDTGPLFSVISSFIFAFGSITNLGAVRIAHSLLEGVKFPSRFLALAYSVGFVGCVAWSPYFASVNLVLHYTGLSLGKYFIFGFIYGLSILIIGNLFFRIWSLLKANNLPNVSDLKEIDGQFIASDNNRADDLFHNLKLKKLLLILAGLILTVVVFEYFSTLSSTMYLVSLTAAFYAVLWALCIKRLRQFFQALKNYYKTVLEVKNELVFFLCVGFFGVIMTHTPFQNSIEGFFGQVSGLSIFFLVEIIILTILVLSIAGIHPGITITTLGLSLNPAVLGISTIAYALSLIAGWLNSMLLSPFVVTNIVVSGLVKESPFLLGFKWNRVLGLIVLIFSGVYITLVNMLYVNGFVKL
ncbi:hypothetical protein [Desulfitibacter alkalitolerans]|uniref:hypothetical protein n=1 Tax=Desulfitibacter alkalitolerans TaxID=264641 RepID=UPI00048413F4|nr:hypothetical protein [Desulfitibacter alkalitolerans]